MNRVFSILVLFTTGLHSTLGCCWHHDHTCADNCCEHPSAIAQECPCDGHRHDSHHDHGKNSDNPSKNDDQAPCKHECAGDSCNFARTEPSLDEFKLTLSEWFALDNDVCLQVPVTVDPHLDFDAADWLLASGPPLRTHLLHQILLI